MAQFAVLELNDIVEVVGGSPNGASVEDIGAALKEKLPRRTLQRRLALPVEEKRLIVEGRARGTRYRLPITTGEANVIHPATRAEARGEIYVPIRIS